MPLGAVLCLLRLLGFQRNIHAFAYLLKLGNFGAGSFQFTAPLRIASAVLYFYIAWLYSFFSDGLVDINLYSLVFRGKEFVKGTMLPAQRISPQPAGTLVT